MNVNPSGDREALTWSSLTRGGKIAVVFFMAVSVSAIVYALLAFGDSGADAEPSPDRGADTGPSGGYAEVLCERAVADEITGDADFESESEISGQTVYVNGTAETEHASFSYGCVVEGDGEDLTLVSVDVRN